MGQEKTVKVTAPDILNRITPIQYGVNIESQWTIPPLKEFAFRLINGVVRVREFAYYEYGY